MNVKSCAWLLVYGPIACLPQVDISRLGQTQREMVALT